MAAPWEHLGEIASVAQLTGLDAVKLIGLIVQAANTARMHKKNCKQFARHLKLIVKKNIGMGVEAKKFGELLMSSGDVSNEDICWATFHGGYDFGYLIKLLTGKNLAETQEGFFELMNVFFPRVYDIKHIISSRS
ncbi:hypothetical protein CTI12_AA380500 [Artemisia annua]|uniref:MCAfunc domain-containing protein n=1 Tax=Artemisia annua TaxID=35608 RepID=A0A2U1MHD3_ARTAN|nr:hypothetical protein CTI12_AA380500 [Artemisia annua]